MKKLNKHFLEKHPFHPFFMFPECYLPKKNYFDKPPITKNAKATIKAIKNHAWLSYFTDGFILW